MRLLIASAAVAALLATSGTSARSVAAQTDPKCSSTTAKIGPKQKAWLCSNFRTTKTDTNGGGAPANHWIKQSFDKGYVDKAAGSENGDGSTVGNGVTQEHEIVSPRDPHSGLPTGKRMHKLIAATKKLDSTAPAKVTVPDLKLNRTRAPSTVPTAQDHAISTKGTGAQNGRTTGSATTINGPPKPVNVTKVKTKSNQANE